MLILQKLIDYVREWKSSNIIDEINKIYSISDHQIPDFQLRKFNEIWSDISNSVPFYRDLVEEGLMPDKDLTWDDFKKIPELKRERIQVNPNDLINPNYKISHWSITGGSTGNPIRVPRCSQETSFVLASIWRGRGFYNIRMHHRLFHLWGHSHLFGEGFKRYFLQAKRTIKNTLIGYYQFSAYNLDPERLRRAAEIIVSHKPAYIVGYSRSLVLLAKINVDLADQFHRLNLKAVIATTEAFSDSSDAKLIENTFGCPVAMEYGSAELGVMAYTSPQDGYYRVFWDQFLLEAIPVDETKFRLLVTTLHPRVMPLIRYDIGDCVVDIRSKGISVLAFKEILGRDNDLIEMEPGIHVHPVALIHCIQSAPGVHGVQVVQEQDGCVVFRIMGNPLEETVEKRLRNNLATLHPNLLSCSFEYVDKLEQTIAGKTRWVIKR